MSCGCLPGGYFGEPGERVRSSLGVTRRFVSARTSSLRIKAAHKRPMNDEIWRRIIPRWAEHVPDWEAVRAAIRGHVVQVRLQPLRSRTTTFRNLSHSVCSGYFGDWFFHPLKVGSSASPIRFIFSRSRRRGSPLASPATRNVARTTAPRSDKPHAISTYAGTLQTQRRAPLVNASNQKVSVRFA